jgi:hypothetical protein
MAVEAYQQQLGAVSIRKVARQHSVRFKAVRDRITRGKVSKQKASERMQRLCVTEEASLEIWCKQLEEYGWPTRICQLCKMTEELLKAKGGTKGIRIN